MRTFQIIKRFESVDYQFHGFAVSRFGIPMELRRVTI